GGLRRGHGAEDRRAAPRRAPQPRTAQAASTGAGRRARRRAGGGAGARGGQRPRLPVRAAVPGAEPEEEQALAAVALFDRLLELFSAAYERLKRARGVLDFDDLELIAGELLAANAGLRASWSERFGLLMVDEFQDTNPRQMAILRLLERENLFTVGDELQSIYGFRHADVSLFRERRA